MASSRGMTEDEPLYSYHPGCSHHYNNHSPRLVGYGTGLGKHAHRSGNHDENVDRNGNEGSIIPTVSFSYPNRPGDFGFIPHGSTSTDAESCTPGSSSPKSMEAECETCERIKLITDDTEFPKSTLVDGAATVASSSILTTPTSTTTLWWKDPINAFFQKLLGFDQNPLQSTAGAWGNHHHHNNNNNSAAADLRLSLLSNFSTAYNILSISLALPMIQALYPAVTLPVNGSSLCSSALIAGMIVGQITGGTLGDILGRHRAMTLVMFLQVLAAFFSALACPLHVPAMHHSVISIYHVLAFWRFVLGLGAGGVYPLAATLTAESIKSGKERAKSVALTFSSQGVGYLVVPVVAYWIVACSGGTTTDLSWRILLGLGALPGTILTLVRTRRLLNLKKRLTLNSELSTAGTRTVSHLESSQPRIIPVSVLDAICLEEQLFRKMVGTGGCWFLFDILFYGNTLFQPLVLSTAFGAAETIQKVARDSALLALMALPGYLVSVYAVGKLSPRYIQAQGFFAMGLLYLCIGVFFDILAQYKAALLIVYGLTFFFSNYGPNSTTFMLPSMTFSRPCRSTLNGVCAACGKAGALIGTMVFCTAADRYGQKAVFVCCALLSCVGGVMTLACVSTEIGAVEISEEKNNAEKSQLLEEQRLSSVPFKVVYSQPSLMDYMEELT